MILHMNGSKSGTVKAVSPRLGRVGADRGLTNEFEKRLEILFEVAVVRKTGFGDVGPGSPWVKTASQGVFAEYGWSGG